MYENNIFKVIINSIKNFFKILVTLVAKSVTSIFGLEQKEVKTNNKQETTKQDKPTKKNKKGLASVILATNSPNSELVISILIENWYFVNKNT